MTLRITKMMKRAIFVFSSLSIFLFLVLILSMPTWAGENTLAFQDDKDGSTDSSNEDLLESMKKRIEQKQEKPKIPQPAPQTPQEPQATPDPSTTAPQVPEKTYKNLPPILKRLKDLHDKILDIHSNTLFMRVESCDEINKLSNEAVQVLFKMYSEKIKIEVPDGFELFLNYCKESTAEYQIYGWGQNEYDEIKHHLVGSFKALWQAHFLIDVKNRKGHLFRFTLATQNPRRTAENNFQIVKYEGKITINLPPDDTPTKVPVDGYDLSTVTGAHFVLTPEEDYSVDTGDDPSMWPENRPSRYTVFFIMPLRIKYYSSLRREVYNSNICDHCLIGSLFNLSPEELSRAIEKGVLSLQKEDNCSTECVEYELILEIPLPPLGCKTDKNSGPGAVALAGDCIDHGGFILPTEKNVYVGNKPIARVGDKAFCLIHGVTEIVGDESNNVYSGKKRIARVGDKTKCGAKIMGGSPDTFASRRKP